LTADTVSDPPPKSDVAQGMASTTWYAVGLGYTMSPAVNKMDKISMNDSPGPGWWHQDKHTSGIPLLEAHATWQFETYICVQSALAPTLFFRRAVAKWQIEASFNAGPPVAVTGVITPAALSVMTPDSSTDPGKCPVGGTLVNDWLNTIVTFR